MKKKNKFNLLGWVLFYFWWFKNISKEVLFLVFVDFWVFQKNILFGDEYNFTSKSFRDFIRKRRYIRRTKYYLTEEHRKKKTLHKVSSVTEQLAWADEYIARYRTDPDFREEIIQRQERAYKRLLYDEMLRAGVTPPERLE